LSLNAELEDESHTELGDIIEQTTVPSAGQQMQVQSRREELLAESARVQRQIIEYAELSQSTVQSTRIIAESLAHFNKVPDAPSMGEQHLEDISNKDRERGSGEDHETVGGGSPEIPETSRTSEAP